MSLRAKARQFTVKNQATVVATEPVGDDLVLVTAEARNPDLSWEPGQAVAVVVDPDGSSMKDRWRHYTVRAYRPEQGTVDFLLTRHDPDTPGGRWIRSLEAGSEFTFMGPGGSPVFRPGADHYLLVGDRTSLASISAMLDALSAAHPHPHPEEGSDGATPTVDVIVATPNPTAAALPTTKAYQPSWVRAATAEEIREAAVAALPASIPTGTRAYVTGEMKMMRAVRDALVERGVPKRQIGSHAHWTPDRRGM
ncbi:MAG: siderophore-interacting protein [Actinomycetota bacterium]